MTAPLQDNPEHPFLLQAAAEESSAELSSIAPPLCLGSSPGVKPDYIRNRTGLQQPVTGSRHLEEKTSYLQTSLGGEGGAEQGDGFGTDTPRVLWHLLLTWQPKLIMPCQRPESKTRVSPANPASGADLENTELGKLPTHICQLL